MDCSEAGIANEAMHIYIAVHVVMAVFDRDVAGGQAGMAGASLSCTTSWVLFLPCKRFFDPGIARNEAGLNFD